MLLVLHAFAWVAVAPNPELTLPTRGDARHCRRHVETALQRRTPPVALTRRALRGCSGKHCETVDTPAGRGTSHSAPSRPTPSGPLCVAGGPLLRHPSTPTRTHPPQPHPPPPPTPPGPPLYFQAPSSILCACPARARPLPLFGPAVAPRQATGAGRRCFRPDSLASPT